MQNFSFTAFRNIWAWSQPQYKRSTINMFLRLVSKFLLSKLTQNGGHSLHRVLGAVGLLLQLFYQSYAPIKDSVLRCSGNCFNYDKFSNCFGLWTNSPSDSQGFAPSALDSLGCNLQKLYPRPPCVATAIARIFARGGGEGG